MASQTNFDGLEQELERVTKELQVNDMTTFRLSPLMNFNILLQYPRKVHEKFVASY